MSDIHYLVATVKPWHLYQYESYSTQLPGHWSLVTSPKSLEAVVEALSPRYIFFPHWSWRVPEEIYNNFECVCFHMTDLPYGRGGSPLQNLILQGRSITQVSALRMVEALDEGPVYCKRTLTLEGRAEAVFQRLAVVISEMIERFVDSSSQGEPLSEKPQKGDAVYFQRRLPEESRIDNVESIHALYDQIRMVDAPSYPLAYLEHTGYRFSFSEAEYSSALGYIDAKVRITKLDDK